MIKQLFDKINLEVLLNKLPPFRHCDYRIITLSFHRNIIVKCIAGENIQKYVIIAFA